MRKAASGYLLLLSAVLILAVSCSSGENKDEQSSPDVAESIDASTDAATAPADEAAKLDAPINTDADAAALDQKPPETSEGEMAANPEAAPTPEAEASPAPSPEAPAAETAAASPA